MQSGVKVRLLALSDGSLHEQSFQYVIAYNPDLHREDGAYDGGDLITTFDPAAAARFATIEEAMALWRAQPSCGCHATRPDGCPNRPLTAFNVEIS